MLEPAAVPLLLKNTVKPYCRASLHATQDDLPETQLSTKKPRVCMMTAKISCLF
jgi:hypothetical protein